MKILIKKESISALTELQDYLGFTSVTKTLNYFIPYINKIRVENNKLINENMCLKMELQMLKENKKSNQKQK